MYADNLVIFIAPTEQDFLLVRDILEIFAGASGLHTNLGKCQIMPIQCSRGQVELTKQLFPCQLGQLDIWVYPFRCTG
jgi:hypothetical protein